VETEALHPTSKSDATKLLILLIGWGDWGRNPNLKGSAPTPGIGLQRRAAQRFVTITIPEAYTSKTCPCCQTRTLINPKVGVTAKHNLLRFVVQTMIACAVGGTEMQQGASTS
jgi:hypothetical protein